MSTDAGSERAERCAACRFWENDSQVTDDGWGRGQCRRYPPVVIEGACGDHFSEDWESEVRDREMRTGVFPLTFASQWCGEWQKKVVHQCPSCGALFELRPGVNRVDKLTCSNTCRTNLYRRRKAMAKSLRSQGRTAHQIAEELGADLAAVEKWVANIEPNTGGDP